MANILATLDLYRLGTTDYSAGRARTNGSWHLVRKQYGDDSATFNYAKFDSRAAYVAARSNPALASWMDEPYSEFDYTLLLLPLSTPLAASTVSAGAIAAPSGGGSSDAAPIVAAIDAGNALLATMINGQSSGGPRATETTLAVVAKQLAGTLSVTAPGGLPVTGAFYPASQPVSLAAVPLAAGAATATLQTSGNALLTDVKGLLGGALTFTMPTGAATSAAQLIANASLASLDAKGATSAKQDAQQQALEAIRVSTAVSSTSAQQATANAYLATLAGLAGPQPASAYNLVSLAGNNAKSVRAGATWLLGGTVTNTANAFRYLMLYNLADAPVTASVPNMILAIEPGRTITLPIPAGRYVGFPAGLGIAGGTASVLGALSTVVAVVGTGTGLSAGELVINLSYAN